MNFKNMRDKAIKQRDKAKEKIGKTDFKGVWNKAVEKSKEPQTKKLVVKGAIGAAVAVAFGGGIVPALALAAVEGVVVKKWSDAAAKKEAAEKEADEKKTAPAVVKKPAPRKSKPRTKKI